MTDTTAPPITAPAAQPGLLHHGDPAPLPDGNPYTIGETLLSRTSEPGHPGSLIQRIVDTADHWATLPPPPAGWPEPLIEDADRTFMTAEARSWGSALRAAQAYEYDGGPKAWYQDIEDRCLALFAAWFGPGVRVLIDQYGVTTEPAHPCGTDLEPTGVCLTYGRVRPPYPGALLAEAFGQEWHTLEEPARNAVIHQAREMLSDPGVYGYRYDRSDHQLIDDYRAAVRPGTLAVYAGHLARVLAAAKTAEGRTS